MKASRGMSLVELLVVLAVSGIVMAAMYGIFIGQQRNYGIQDQVVELQQGLRAAMDRMTREIRMAGYGGDILAAFGEVNGFSQLITPVDNGHRDSITILMAQQVTTLSQNAAAGATTLQLSVASAGDLFNTTTKRYLCLNGLNNYRVLSVSGSTVTLATPLGEDHLANEPVFLVKAITYRISPDTTDLVRDENTGEGGQLLAECVERLELRYTLSGGTVVDQPGDASDIRMVDISLTARTKLADSGYPGDGYRRQSLRSSVEVRNLGL